MQQITRSSSNELDPAISPDAKSLAYEVADSLDRPPRLEVVELADALSERTARPRPRPLYSSQGALGAEPAWMPDGSRLVFVSNALGPRALVETIGPSPAETRLLGAVGDPTLVGAWPAVAPNGTVAMTLGGLDVFESSWRRQRHVDSALGLSDLAGSSTRVIGEGSDPAWSPDGARLAISRMQGGRSHLFVMNADGTGAMQITNGSDDDLHPSWSPDGKTIVFCSAHATGETWTQANLFVVRPDGSGLLQLTEGDRVACRPDWAKDGFIYFHANATDRFHIWRVRPAQRAEAEEQEVTRAVDR
jgi:Tol biopolymer transport system component